MLLDVSSSRRIDALVHHRDPFPMHSLIVSRLFWPDDIPAAVDDFTPHSRIQKSIDAYTAAYSNVRPDRRISMYPRLGTVKLSVESDDGETREFTCDPVQASFLLAVTEPGDVNALGLDKDETEAVADFWLRHGVIQKEGNGRWVGSRAFDRTDRDGGDSVAIVAAKDDDDDKSGGGLTDQQVSIVAKFSLGMLTNVSDQSVAQVFDRLKGVLAPMGIVFEQDDIRHVLDDLCAKEKLECVSGMYSVKR